ncbi:phage cell wall peptidase, NlpC/P60 family [Methylopila sp. Yamaguchi]|nr:phage cell wall peptidase, NlpC/P60 family [Methylopila sp. Yamaguchi]
MGAGADCLGVVRGVWRELIGPEPEALAPYARTWAEDGGAEMLLSAARRRLVELPPDEIAPGDVLLFRVRRDGPARHAGVATGAAAMVHAYDGHAVAETAIPDVWRRRLVARFRFPAAGPRAEVRASRRAYGAPRTMRGPEARSSRTSSC